MEFILAALGLVILLVAGEALVRGAVNLSIRAGIPALIVSLTVVAFGTSAPELLVAVSAVSGDAPGIAIGNVVGSNIANVALVLGIPALVAGLGVPLGDTRRSFVLMMGASVLFVGVCLLGPITWVHGTVMLAAFGMIIAMQIAEARAHRRGHRDEPKLEGADPTIRRRTIVFYLAVGLIGLPLGADLLVEGSVVIARDFGVSDAIIGLTLVAIGTSLPELATSAMAAVRRQSDVALGNVIGSNLFNVLAIIGVASFMGRIPVDDEIIRFDLWVMLAASAVLAPFIFLRLRIGRGWGAALIACYGVYVYVLLH